MVAVGLSNARLLCLYETLSWTKHAHRTEGTLHDAAFSPNGRCAPCKLLKMTRGK